MVQVAVHCFTVREDGAGSIHTYGVLTLFLAPASSGRRRGSGILQDVILGLMLFPLFI